MDKTTFKRSFRLSLVLIALLGLGVGVVGAWEWWQAQRPPSRKPDLQGRIVDAGGRYMVESPQGGRCWFYPPKGTRILRHGEPGTLAVGQRVSVWHDGITYDTYPMGAKASWVVIEEDGPPA